MIKTMIFLELVILFRIKINQEMSRTLLRFQKSCTLDGVDYISDTQSKNSSSIAKYVTKEVSIENPATSIDVRTTVNVSDIENIKILYKN